jgi:hypothetical protein
VPQDATLDTLLDLDGQKFLLGDQGEFRVEMAARRVPPSSGKPHGIDYSLVLIGPKGQRLVGYDNAHPVRVGRGPGGRGPVARDHRHKARGSWSTATRTRQPCSRISGPTWTLC